MGAFPICPEMSRFVPVCPLLSRFVPVPGPKKDKRGQTATKRDILGQIGKRHHLAPPFSSPQIANVGWPRSTVEKGPQSSESYERESPWNRTISTVLWVHKKFPQSTVKLVLPSNESYESKMGCNRTLATVLWVCSRLLAFDCVFASVFACVCLRLFARICLRPPLLRPPLRDTDYCPDPPPLLFGGGGGEKKARKQPKKQGLSLRGKPKILTKDRRNAQKSEEKKNRKSRKKGSEGQGISISVTKILVSVLFCPQFWGWKWLRQFYGRLEKLHSFCRKPPCP